MPISSSARTSPWRSVVPFFIGLGVALGLAFLAPEWGAKDGPLPVGWLSVGSVALIFFIQGIQLPVADLQRGLTAWQTHAFVQLWIFAACPLLAWLVALLCGSGLGEAERIGLLLLGFVATTVATNAAYTAMAGGNVAVSLVNIVLGNILGVVITPVAFGLLLASDSGTSIDIRPLLIAILGQLVLPFALGQIARWLWKPLADWAARHKGLLRETTSWLIYLIVYFAACSLLTDARFADQVVFGQLAWTVAATLLLLSLVKITCWYALALLALPHPDRVAAFFAATQKTLAAGLPLATAVHAASSGEGGPPLAVLVFPLMIYHVGQLIVGALLIPLFAAPSSCKETPSV